MRNLALSVAALLLPLSLAGCDSGHDTVATDPATGVPSTSPPAPTPTPSPTVGSYPEFAPTDYTFQLTVACFCAGAGTPIQVTVADGEVVGSTYTADDTGRGGTQAGAPADHAFWLTIQDVIDQANNTEADRVDVDWPAGQDYPNSVYVDENKQTMDEEVGYTISDVQLG
jgi:hypothetical protein